MLDVKLSEILSKAFSDLGYGEGFGQVGKSNRPELCQYQCNDSFKVAKMNKKNPIEVGESVVAYLQGLEDFNDIFSSVEFVKPGFINISLTDSYIAKVLNAIKSDEKLLVKQVQDKTVVIDYGGANIAKPMHVGHLRSAVIGESIKRLYTFLGYKAIGDVHLGDFGLQMGQVVYGLRKHGLAEDIYFDANSSGPYPDKPLFTIKNLETIYPEISKLCKENEEVKKEVEQITKELQDGRSGYVALFEHVNDISIEDLKKGYGSLNVFFDLWFGERSSRKYIEPTEALLNEKNLLRSDKGAMVVDVSREDDKKVYPPLIFKKHNGGLLYGTTDLATIYQRMTDYNPYEIVYVVDKRQTLHFEQVFRVCELSGLSKETKLNHYGFGTMNGKDGKPFKTRDGGALFLQDLFQIVLDEIQKKQSADRELSKEDEQKILNSVIKFADLQSYRETDYIFDLDKFTEFTGKTGPYTLYTCVRINRLLDKVREETEFSSEITDNVYSDVERSLRLRMLDTQNVLDLAFREKSMHHICEYVYDLCTMTNNIYQSNHLLTEDDKNKVKSIANTLEMSVNIITKMLNILGIDIPEKM